MNFQHTQNHTDFSRHGIFSHPTHMRPVLGGTVQMWPHTVDRDTTLGARGAVKVNMTSSFQIRLCSFFIQFDNLAWLNRKSSTDSHFTGEARRAQTSAYRSKKCFLLLLQLQVNWDRIEYTPRQFEELGALQFPSILWQNITVSIHQVSKQNSRPINQTRGVEGGITLSWPPVQRLV